MPKNPQIQTAADELVLDHDGITLQSATGAELKPSRIAPHVKNVLIVAPHCDDEILGCGGLVAKYAAAGKSIYVAIVTNGHLGAPELFSREGTERVRKEAVTAHQTLGVKQTYFLDFPCPRLDSIPSYTLALRINELIRELKVDTLYIPHRGDIHKDHRITYEASLVAARPVNNCPVKRIYAYETLSETEWAPPFGDDAFIPTVFEELGPLIEKKKEAFAHFSTQLKEFPHPRSIAAIENLAKYRGATIGVEYAEAYMLIRQIENFNPQDL